jgi:hypothetical protein
MTPTTYQSFEPPTDDWAKTVCLIGKGALCCRYLTLAPGGWSCAKNTSLKTLLDHKVTDNQMGAHGDNCLGRGSR